MNEANLVPYASLKYSLLNINWLSLGVPDLH
jgi:hypothetical protein